MKRFNSFFIILLYLLSFSFLLAPSDLLSKLLPKVKTKTNNLDELATEKKSNTTTANTIKSIQKEQNSGNEKQSTSIKSSSKDNNK
ncbi:MAG: hypothetical protein CL947_00450 [Epsilonproteobacteria bacterium]|nr:hypothetical protein [Campylobacterota bacterium]|tara:strand:+ start:4631 stop:4888 length:258 start_codon:yes stop_codon:yes gene_type:complete